jgi:hypothetical protein
MFGEKTCPRMFLLQNGGLSAVPYICMFFSTVIAGQIADLLRSRKILSTTVTRKIFLSFGKYNVGDEGDFIWYLHTLA